MIVSETDLAPEIPGIQTVWIQGKARTGIANFNLRVQERACLRPHMMVFAVSRRIAPNGLRGASAAPTYNIAIRT